jgi:hypothetical protein
MRKFLSGVLAVLTCFALVSSSFAGFNGVSTRLQGINSNLVGIMADEYSDAMSVNTADALNVEGWRLYTNFSNLYSGNLGSDRAFDGTTTGGSSSIGTFLLGGFGNPLKSFIENAQMGLFYTTTNGTEARPNQLGESGSSKKTQTIYTDNDLPKNGQFNNAGDTVETETATATRDRQDRDSSLSAMFAMPIAKIEGLKAGIKIEKSNTVDNNSNNVKSLEEKINASYNRSLLTYGTPNTTITENDKQNASEKYDNSNLNINLGGRYNLNDKMDIGVTVGLNPQKIKQERNSVVTLNSDSTAGDPNPETVLETMANGSQTKYTGTWADTVVSGGFSWTSSFMGPNSEMNIPGMTGKEIGTYETSGNNITFSADTHYKLQDNLTLVARLNYENLPGDLKASLSLPYEAVTRSYGANWVFPSVTGDKNVVKENSIYSISNGKWNKDYTALTLGGEAKLENNVLLGFGLIYGIDNNETSYDWQKDYSYVDTYDEANDGFKNESGSNDYRETKTYTKKGQKSTKTETNKITIPLGLELRPWAKFPVRLGVSHYIKKTKTTTVDNLIEDGITTTTWESNGNDSGAKTYSYTPVPNNNVNVNNSVENTTSYYYGIGYEWSKNLTFDILGVAGSSVAGGGRTGILDISSWRIGATLKF